MILYGGRHIIKSRTGGSHLKIDGGGLFTAMMHFRHIRPTYAISPFLESISGMSAVVRYSVQRRS